MDIATIVTLFLAFFVLIAAMMILIHKKMKSRHFIDIVYENYYNHLSALFNTEKVPSKGKITKKQRQTILSISREEWDEWDIIANSVQHFGEKYYEVFKEYLIQSYPGIMIRPSYCMKEKDFASTKEIIGAFIGTLTLEELRLVYNEKESNWELREKSRQLALKIISKYPNGYDTYKELKENIPITSYDVIRDKKSIKEYQVLYENNKSYEGFEKHQDDFCNHYYTFCKNHRKNDGRFCYYVNFKKPTKTGTLIDCKFKIWQGFSDSFSRYHLEIQNHTFLETFKTELQEFKEKSRFFIDQVYDGIFNIIQDVRQYSGDKIIVVFVNSGNYNWTKSSYDFQYKYLKQVLRDHDFYYCDYENFQKFEYLNDCKAIILIDFISSNLEMINRCKLIEELMDRSAPVIGYYSLIKEYDESEIKEIFKESIAKSDDISYIKELFEKVNKNAFFSYTAIINTLLGEAIGADKTKQIWLYEPKKYSLKFSSTMKSSVIVVDFSTDGGISYTEKEYEGDSLSLDAVCEMCYDLLSIMGILSDFKLNGAKAIDFINESEFLAYH